MKIAVNTTKCIFTKMLAQCPDYRLDNIGLNHGRGKRFFSPPNHVDWLWAHPISCSVGTMDLSQR